MDDVVTLNSLMNDLLLAELGEGLDSLADRLTGLYEGWRKMGADQASVAFVGAMLEELGWWRGRIDAALAPPSVTP